jgi:hypothetical protein
MTDELDNYLWEQHINEIDKLFESFQVRFLTILIFLPTFLILLHLIRVIHKK